MSKQHKRRATDICLAKRWWDKATPYAQIGGFVPVLGGIITVIYLICVFISKTEAYGPAINTLQGQFFAQHDTLISIQQEVHDIHEWVKATHHQ
jgi:hypothetical protein